MSLFQDQGGSGNSIMCSLINTNNVDELKRTIKETAYKPSAKEFKVYRYRYVVALLYGLALAITSLLFPLFNPIATVVQVLYDQGTTIVNYNSLLYLLMHPIFTFPANMVIEKLGVRKSIMLGSLFCLAGSWIRLLINESFYIVIVGSIVCGIGRPFILNVQGKVVATWFFPKDRSMVTSLFSFIITAFTVIGVLFPGMIFSDYQKSDALVNPSEGKSLMTKLILIEACVTTAFLIPNLLFQRDKPPSPPSFTCTVSRQTPGEGLKSVLKNKNYIILWFVYCIYFGSFNAVSVVQANIMYTYDIKTPSENSVIGSVPVATGFVSVIIVSILLKKYWKFKLILMIFIAGCIVSITLMPQIICHGYYAAIGSSLLNGVFVIPAVPLMLELGIELTFPVSESIGVGLLFAGGQLWGAGIGMVVSSFAKGVTQSSSDMAIYTFSGLFGVAFVLCIFLQEDLRRIRAEKTKNMTSINLTVNQWNQIKGDFGGDAYTAKDHQGVQTDQTDHSED